MSRLRPLLIFGTRPEAIKMAPVVEQCRRRQDLIEPIVCMTGQHRELLGRVTEYFQITADLQLDVMQPDQSLAALTARSVERIEWALADVAPDCVVVQGDTTTVMAASLAAYYRRIPLVHVEAGLRTGDLYAPWPEELNRRIADQLAALHCAPTQGAADNLLTEGVSPRSVHVTGNTVVDALLDTVKRERANAGRWREKYPMLGDAPMILVTGHRRESFGQGLRNIVRAMDTLARRFPECRFVWPVHLNPNVSRPVRGALGGRPNVHLIDPASYPEFVWLMDRSRLILTDSGGVQEEAPSLRKPVVVMRQATDRPELVAAGGALVVGTAVEAIVEAVTGLLTDPAKYAACQVDHNPYGDGHAAERIVDLMLQQGWEQV